MSHMYSDSKSEDDSCPRTAGRKPSSGRESLQVLSGKILEDDCSGFDFWRENIQRAESMVVEFDSLGVDEDDRPVIIEYKRAVNENVVDQGLFCLALAP